MRRVSLPALYTQRRRGSVYVLVIAILAVLVLMSVTLGYITKVDLMASRNWASMVQNKMDPLAKVPAVNPTPTPQAGVSGQASLSASTGQVSYGTTGAQMGLAAAPTSQAGYYGVASQSNYGATGGATPYIKLEPLTLRIRPEEGALLNSQEALPDGTAQEAAGGPSSQPAATNAASGTAGEAANGTASGTGNGAGEPGSAPAAAVSLAVMEVEDESAKINLNAVVPEAETKETLTQNDGAAPAGAGSAQAAPSAPPAFISEAMLGRFITTTLEARGISGISGQDLAHAIAMRRLGPNGKPDTPSAREQASQRAETQAQQAWTGIQALPTPTLSQDETDTRTETEAEKLAESAMDPRVTPVGDDCPYTALEELMSLPGMTLDAYKALAPYLTTLSVSFAAFDLTDSRTSQTLTGQTPTGPGGSVAAMTPTDQAGESAGTNAGEGTSGDQGREQALGFPQIDPNTAAPEMIFDVLRRRFPQAPEALLGQFVANLIDRRDADDIPTVIKLGTETYYGQELTPCINEVCPHPSFSENPDGQYIELYNPYSKAMDVSGWSLHGCGSAIALTGSIPGGGYLVVTNDDNNGNDPDAVEEDKSNDGSLYNLFHVVATGANKQIKECPELSLPQDSGKIQLVSADGHVMDEFDYQGASAIGALKSFQRKDPRLRASEALAATPLAPNTGAAGDEETARALRIQEEWQNKPFRSALDVMLVSTAYIAQPAAQGMNTGSQTMGNQTLSGQVMGGQATQASAAHPFALPELAASGSSNLDVRLVDCFRVGAKLPAAQSSLAAATQQATQTAQGAENAGSSGSAEEGTRPTALPTPPRCAKVLGRLNLNTAPAATLAALPGMDAQLLGRIEQSRSEGPVEAGQEGQGQQTASLNAKDEAWWAPVDPFAAPRWHNLSDFLQDETVWQGRPLYDRLDAIYPFCQLVTMHSMALRAYAANRPYVPPSEAKEGRRPNLVRVERQIVGDRGVVESVSFKYLGTYSEKQPDPDLLYATPLSKAQSLNMDEVVQRSREQRGIAVGAGTQAERDSEAGANTN